MMCRSQAPPQLTTPLVHPVYYPCVHTRIEPFFPPKPLNQLVRDQAAGNVFTSKLSFNLLTSMGKQGAFLHRQVYV